MNKIIIILLGSITVLYGQNKGIITLPIGEGGGDSLGNVIQDTRVLLGQGTNLATSTDSLVWDAGFEVTGPVRFLALPNLTEGAGDSLLMINTTGSVFKTVITGGTPAGSAEEVQFRNGGSFGANSLFQWINSDHVLGIGIAAPTAPDYFLHLHHPVTNSATGVYYTNATSGTTLLSDGFFTGYSDKAFFVNYENTPIEWWTNATLRMTIGGTGGVFLNEALTINNTWDTVLVRNNVTGRIEGRDASSFGGGSADSLGTNVTTGRVVFGLGNKTPGNSANLFWDNSSSELAIGHTSPAGDLHVISTDPTNRSSLIGQNDNSATAFTSTFPALSLRNDNSTANNYVRINFQDASSTAAASIASQITDHTNDYGTLEFWTRSASGFSQKLSITDVGNIGIGTQTFGTSAVGVIAMANGTAPSTSPANAVQLYVEDVSSSAELKVRDEAGNVTVLSTPSDGWTEVILGSDFTISTTSNNNVTGFNFTPVANRRYLIEGRFLLRTATATTGARPGIAWPTGLTEIGSNIDAPNSNTAQALRLQGAISTQNAASTGLPTTTDSYLSTWHAVMITGGSPSGTVQITLASETAAINVTMRAGSILRYKTY